MADYTDYTDYTDGGADYGVSLCAPADTDTYGYTDDDIRRLDDSQDDVDLIATGYCSSFCGTLG